MLISGQFTERTANTDKDLREILALQALNLKRNVTDEERRSQGFVTLEHDLNTLRAMNDQAPHVIITHEERVVAYALSQTKESSSLQPDLEPLFQMIDRLTWKNSTVDSFQYYVMGQVCIASEFRGHGLFERLYQHHKKIFSTRFNLFITEISTSNPRSARAHQKIGFVPVHQYRDHLDEWSVVAWDWNQEFPTFIQ